MLVWQVYAGPLEDGSRAVALFNRHTSGTQYPLSNITVHWESIGRDSTHCTFLDARGHIAPMAVEL